MFLTYIRNKISENIVELQTFVQFAEKNLKTTLSPFNYF